jgi:hypothetical protein
VCGTQQSQLREVFWLDRTDLVCPGRGRAHVGSAHVINGAGGDPVVTSGVNDIVR